VFTWQQALSGVLPMTQAHSHDHARKHDHDHSHEHEHEHEHAHEHCCSTAKVPERVDLGPVSEASRLERFRIEQMDCPTEQTLIQDKLARMDGVEQLQFNLINRVLGVQHRLADHQAIVAAIAELGMQAQPLDEASSTPPSPPPPRRHWLLGVSGVAALAAEVLHLGQWAPEPVVALVALLSIALGGLGTYRKGWIALKNRNLNINALMSIAVTGALLIGQWPEAAMVMFLFTLAELIEARSLSRARDAIGSLMQLTPDQATLQQPDGQWRQVPAADVVIDSVVRVAPGERIALDGEVLAGQSSVDQAAITGESLPVEKAVGDPVYAGTLNQNGSLEVRVTSPASQSTLARIIQAVEQAQGARAPTQRFVDRFSRIYTPLVFVLALAVALVPPLLLGGLWFDWVYRALVLLVVACPCALVIGTPVTVVSGLAAAARQGILIKGGTFLESGYKLDVLALDKTGTLTHGRPVQTDYLALGTAPDAQALGASLAARSDHPVSKAIAAAFDLPPYPVEQFQALPGQGVQGEIEGRRYYLGNYRLARSLGQDNAALQEQVETLERQGKSAVLLLAAEGPPLAIFAVADTLKPGSREAVDALKALGIRTLMLTGDNRHTAQAIATEVGISEARGELLPADKLQAIETLVNAGQRVGMVGDGINDAPALARADIGFAMGAAGSHSALETADVALMDDDLRKLPAFIRLSRRTRTVLMQNIVLALGIKAVFLGITLAGMATLWMAVFADMGVSLLVVFNGLRLLRR
jgi:Cd2+/Zn2+-exporting ATPase